jgi:hypothetical protein
MTKEAGAQSFKETTANSYGWNHDKKSGCDYRIIPDGDTIFIDFRGSSEKKDWIKDFLFFPKKLFTSVYIHGGFLDQYLFSRNDILNTIYQPKWKEYIIRGYSLGGALAQIAVYDIAYHIKRDNLPITVKGIVYESPRPFIPNKAVKSILLPSNTRPLITAVKTFNDIFIHLPPFFSAYNKSVWIGKWYKFSPYPHLGKAVIQNLIDKNL